MHLARLDTKPFHHQAKGPKKHEGQCPRTHLIQGFAGHLDAINLQDFIVNRQQSGALRQTSGHQTGDEDTGHLEKASHASGKRVHMKM